MGSGKSTVGCAAATRLVVPYIDNDDEIARLAGEPTVELARRGGDELHRWEAAYADALHRRRAPYIAGLPASCADRPSELWALRRDAVVVYLRCDANTLIDRVTQDTPRPWLDTDNSRGFVEQTLARRDPVLSSLAHQILDATAALPTIVNALVRLAAPSNR